MRSVSVLPSTPPRTAVSRPTPAAARLLAFIVAGVLAACGGGSGGPAATVAASPTAQPAAGSGGSTTSGASGAAPTTGTGPSSSSDAGTTTTPHATTGGDGVPQSPAAAGSSGATATAGSGASSDAGLSLVPSDGLTPATTTPVTPAQSQPAASGDTARPSGTTGTGAVAVTPATVVEPAAPNLSAAAIALSVDAGPRDAMSAAITSVNQLYASVTICTPGSATACQVIDHLLVDTGSVGLRVLASQVGPAVAGTQALAPTGQPLRECLQFADGFTWGTVRQVDVVLGAQRIASLPVQWIADPAAGAAPTSCSSGSGIAISSVDAFGARGILGVGHFLQDCGSACATKPVPGTYYACTAAGACTATTVPLAQQVSNPVAALGAEANGLTLTLSPVAQSGAAIASGTLQPGVATRPSNTLTASRAVTLTAAGTLTTTYAGIAIADSFFDTGSNGLYFDAALTRCAANPSFYCPAASLPQSAVVTGTNGASVTLPFQVDNAVGLFATGHAALPGLAGPMGSVAAGVPSGFDWGLPFFYGRTVQMLFEGSSLNGVPGPALLF